MNYRDCISMPVVPFLDASGMGRTKLYELLAAGEIKSVTVGKKRLVIIQSFLNFLERQAHAAPIPSPNPRSAHVVNGGPPVDQPRRRDRRISKTVEEYARELTDHEITREALKIGRVITKPRPLGRPPGSKTKKRRSQPQTGIPAPAGE
jgi:hypothetical protein